MGIGEVRNGGETVAVDRVDAASEPMDWGGVRLVVFDVDGTLYDQRRLRLGMAVDLALDAVRRRSLATLRIVSAYRRIREHLGDEEVDGFDPILLERTAAAAGSDPSTVAATVSEWIERRPLPAVARCRVAGIEHLFEALRRREITIGVFSDYPARDKLAALGLAADHVVSAADPDIGRLKPHPLGLETLMRRAGAGPAETVLIGDRVDRDAAVATRCGVRALIRSRRRLHGVATFARFDDQVFAPLLSSSRSGEAP